MPRQTTGNSDDYRILTVRLEKETIQRLTTLAGSIQAADGIRVTVSDLVRTALLRYLKEQQK